MNYTCVVVGGMLLFELAWWFYAGKKYSETVQRAREEEGNPAIIAHEKEEAS